MLVANYAAALCQDSIVNMSSSAPTIGSNLRNKCKVTTNELIRSNLPGIECQVLNRSTTMTSLYQASLETLMASRYVNVLSSMGALFSPLE